MHQNLPWTDRDVCAKFYPDRCKGLNLYLLKTGLPFWVFPFYFISEKNYLSSEGFSLKVFMFSDCSTESGIGVVVFLGIGFTGNPFFSAKSFFSVQNLRPRAISKNRGLVTIVMTMYG